MMAKISRVSRYCIFLKGYPFDIEQVWANPHSPPNEKRNNVRPKICASESWLDCIRAIPVVVSKHPVHNVVRTEFFGRYVERIQSKRENRIRYPPIFVIDSNAFVIAMSTIPKFRWNVDVVFLLQRGSTESANLWRES